MTSWTPPNKQHPPPKPGEPPLHRAARLGDEDGIRRLIAAGADPNAIFDIALDPGAYRRPATPLMVAAGSGDGASAGTVALLLALGADPKLVIAPDSAATFAAEGLGWNYRPGGDADRLLLLLQADSPLPAHPYARNRLLCTTAALGDPVRLRILLSHGLDARGFFDPDIARKQATAISSRMMEFHASHPDLFASIPQDLRPSFLESMKNLDNSLIDRSSSAPSSLDIPLFRAAESGNAECVRALLDAGADPSARDYSNQTAMYHAASLAVIRELMRAGLPLEDADEFGWTPLCNALREADALSRVRDLIEAGANVNASHDRGYTILMSALGQSEDRSLDVIRLLVASGADPHAVSELGYNAFHAAVDADNSTALAIFSYLKELGVDIEHRNEDDHTPLARAIQSGTGVEVAALCQVGADPNSVCSMHRCGPAECTQTALPLLFHAAVGICTDKDLKADALLLAGADPFVKDANGHTPLALAVASLCSPAPDYPAAFRSFFIGLQELALEVKPMPGTRDDFLAHAVPTLRAYVDRFAAGIPLTDNGPWAASVRAERVGCITLLCAHEAWRRHERSGRNPA